MKELTRTCADCGTDISVRHQNAKRCTTCSSKANATATSHSRERTIPCTVDNDECVPGRLRRGLCDKHYRRAKGKAKPKQARVCIVCDAPFETFDPRKVACSLACNLWRHSHPGEPRPLGGDCLICGFPIRGKRAGADYCSQLCMRAANTNVSVGYDTMM